MSEGTEEYESERYNFKNDSIVSRTLVIGPEIQPKSPLCQVVQNFLTKINHLSASSRFVLKTNRAKCLYIQATGILSKAPFLVKLNKIIKRR